MRKPTRPAEWLYAADGKLDGKYFCLTAWNNDCLSLDMGNVSFVLSRKAARKLLRRLAAALDACQEVRP